MSHLTQREINGLSTEARLSRLKELEEEMLQLRAEKSMGGSPSNMGAFKATRHSIARLKATIRNEVKE
jgi:ribosomal protein L29